MNLPLSDNFADADIAVLNIPYDGGRDPIRFGSRQGPNAIRHASILTGELIKDASPPSLDTKKVIDAGNIQLLLENIEQVFVQIETAITEILKQDC